MFDIGFWEILLISILALIVLGPERLPGAIRSVVSTVRNIKQVANGFKQEVVNQLDTHELHSNLKKAEDLGMKNLSKELQDSVDQLKSAAASVNRTYKKPDEKLGQDIPRESKQTDAKKDTDTSNNNTTKNSE